MCTLADTSRAARSGGMVFLLLLVACTSKDLGLKETGGQEAKAEVLPSAAPPDSGQPIPAPERDSLRALMRQYYEEVWNKGKYILRDSYLAADYRGHLAGISEPLDRDSWVRQLKDLRQGFPDAKFTVEDIVVEGDRVTTRYTLQGSHTGRLRWLAPTGRRIHVTGISMERIKDGKIVESWNQNDALRMWQQLGVLSDPVAPATQFESTPIRFLSPGSYTRVPQAIRRSLESRGCRIPQWLKDSVPGNIVQGGFTTGDRADWAALCTRVRTDILVFRPDSSVDSLSARMDHALGVAEPEYIVQHLESYGQDSLGHSLEGKGDSLAKAITRQGIEESDDHCCSRVHYWDGSRWVIHPGAD